jgi:hypothetical protein
MLTRFISRFPTSQRPRDNDSLKLKFKSLRLARKPTGDPTCPPEVRRAKLIYRDIERNADVVGAADSEDEELAILEDTGKLIFKYMSALSSSGEMIEGRRSVCGEKKSESFAKQRCESVMRPERNDESSICEKTAICRCSLLLHYLVEVLIMCNTVLLFK